LLLGRIFLWPSTSHSGCLSEGGLARRPFVCAKLMMTMRTFVSPCANCLGNPASADCDSSSEDFQGEAWPASQGSMLHCAGEEGIDDERQSFRSGRSCAACGWAAEGERPVAISVMDNPRAGAIANQFRAIGLPTRTPDALSASDGAVGVLGHRRRAGQQATTVGTARCGMYPCEPLLFSSTRTSALGKRKRHRRTPWRILILVVRKPWRYAGNVRNSSHRATLTSSVAGRPTEGMRAGRRILLRPAAWAGVERC
jgi:hypothetical protein